MPDEKVVTRVIQTFEEALPTSNKYIVLRSRALCKFVKTDIENVYYSCVGSKDFWEIIGDVSAYRYIIIHYLSFDAVDFINKIKHDGIVWCIWGADLYNNILEHKGFQIYENPIRELLSSLRYSPKETIKHKIRLCLYRQEIDKAISKISYEASLFDCDYRMLLKYYPRNSISLKKLFYYPIDTIVSNIDAKEALGNNIMLGNSASYTNNHVGVLKMLSAIGNQRTIITPLSYGAGKRYVTKMGYKYCPDTFMPITDFLPIEKYNRLLMSASTFIYAHFRHEAMGNIVTALYIGGTVFLYTRNPLFQSLKDAGFIFFPIEDLPQAIDYRLSKEEKLKNRQLAKELFGKDKIIAYIKTGFC